MKYALGPVLWYWPKDRLTTFCEIASQSEADIIYLGETVCSKRRETKFADWMALARELSASGKQVILSTLSLIQAPSELSELKRLVENGEFIIEANDFGTVNMAAERQLPFVAGHALNVYNAQTLQLLQRLGMIRWCMPVELSRDWLINLLAQFDALKLPRQFEIEVFGYGHLPLALSARCFSARAENRSKDACQTCCIDYPQGRQVYSQEDQQVFVLNGIQTMSGECYHLGNHLPGMQGLVDVVRLSPQDSDTPALISRFRANEQGEQPFSADDRPYCDGYWRQLAGLTQVTA
ncbi:U32 family peptidase [Erwinia sp. OLTSP20]|uniref:U32 family peptidase n=1 Tax=unclassified Erwinia TaxID=2622719 RepID=UPI000C1951AB|nr:MULTISPECIES: U32 family peptidase [unclassified Erwinia]PIJ51095.1 U32 family peptidase [Erwinia sp. OAMSP11]PIJ73761.1 U32 family peptidase [Erwinia sp. OLSSP12]PIJ83124.1 U32 family peptidase [Erwinia sp. OLCASP19]PIJ85723.1 U32 family peptidase [Erwinia sp. OLMTSP26]PIJ87677.1 U32 family peptidase [Erwinia sp. OLMDSP33]